MEILSSSSEIFRLRWRQPVQSVAEGCGAITGPDPMERERNCQYGSTREQYRPVASRLTGTGGGVITTTYTHGPQRGPGRVVGKIT